MYVTTPLWGALWAPQTREVKSTMDNKQNKTKQGMEHSTGAQKGPQALHRSLVIKHNRLIQITRRISDKRNIVVSLKVQ